MSIFSSTYLKAAVRTQEVQLLANIVSRDAQSKTKQNVKYIERLTKLSAWDYSKERIAENLKKKEVPGLDYWRLPFLKKLLWTVNCTRISKANKDILNNWISCLCSN